MQKTEINLQNKMYESEISEKLLAIRYHYHAIQKTVLGPKWNTALFRKEFRVISYARIYFPVAGEGFGELKGSLLHFRPGYIYLIPPFSDFHVYCKKRFVKYWIHFNAIFPDNQIDFFNMIDFPLELPVKSMERTIENFETLRRFQGNEPYMSVQPLGLDAVEARAAMNQILIPFLRRAIPVNSQPDKKAKRLMDILYYVEQHLNEHITLQKAADHFGLNPTYLSNFFAENMNDISLIHYLNSRRIEKAFFALSNETVPVKQIAARFGFDDPLVFTRLFKRRVGVTPTEYRMEQRKKHTCEPNRKT